MIIDYWLKSFLHYLHFTNIHICMLWVNLCYSCMCYLQKLRVLWILLFRNLINCLAYFQKAPESSGNVVVDMFCVFDVVNYHKSVWVILSGKLQKVYGMLVRDGLGIQNFGISNIVLVIQWVSSDELFKAELGFLEILFSQVHVAKLQPRLFIDLIYL